MTKEFVPYDRALKLKELGFNEPCFGRFNNDGDLLIAHTEKYIISDGVDRSEFFTLAPLFQQAFRWFKDEHQLFGNCDISNFEDKTYGYNVTTLNLPAHYLFNGHSFSSMEEAELACLDKLIEEVEESRRAVNSSKDFLFSF
jgi:hypothetical protein